MKPSTIMGIVRDIYPNRAKEGLELYFDGSTRSGFDSGPRVAVELEVNGCKWSGTMNTTNPNNPPYFHAALRSAEGATTVNDLFASLGLGHAARLALAVVSPNKLRLVEVLDRGGPHPSRKAR